MRASDSRSTASSSWRHRPVRSRGPTAPDAGRREVVAAARVTALGPRPEASSFDGARAVQAASAGSGTEARTGELDHGVLDELRALHLSLFDSWLSEDQLGRLADAAYRAPPSADRPGPAGVPDEPEPHAADAARRRKA